MVRCRYHEDEFGRPISNHAAAAKAARASLAVKALAGGSLAELTSRLDSGGLDIDAGTCVYCWWAAKRQDSNGVVPFFLFFTWIGTCQQAK